MVRNMVKLQVMVSTLMMSMCMIITQTAPESCGFTSICICPNES